MPDRLKPTLPAPPVLSDQIAFQTPWLRIRAVEKVMPTGLQATFYLRQEHNVAVCLPMTPQGTVILVEQFRHGPDRSLYEIPGGLIDPGEDPLAAGAREALEETGYAGEVQALGSGWMSAYSTARKFTYLMRNAKRMAEPQTDDVEFVRVVEASMDEFRALVLSGELTDPDSGLLCLRALGL